MSEYITENEYLKPCPRCKKKTHIVLCKCGYNGDFAHLTIMCSTCKSCVPPVPIPSDGTHTEKAETMLSSLYKSWNTGNLKDLKDFTKLKGEHLE